MSNTVKNYLITENERNKANAALFTRMIRLAFGDKDQIMIAHHLTFEVDNDLNTVNEIPSADTLIFDHEAMGRIFGKQALSIMKDLAALPVADGSRDKRLAEYVGLWESVASDLRPAT